MTDIVITAGSVVPSATATIARGTSGATVNAGQPVYQDTNNKMQLTNANNVGHPEQAAGVGLAVNTAASGQPIEYVTGGDVAMTTTPALVPGKVYVLGTGIGGLSLSADLDAASPSTRYGSVIGVATTTTNLRIGIVNSGVLRT